MLSAALGAIGGVAVGAGAMAAWQRLKRGQAGRQDPRFQTLVFACEELAAAGVDSQALARAIKAVVLHSHADAGCLYLLDHERPEILTAEAAFSAGGSFDFASHVQVGEGLVGHSANTLHEVRISAARNEKGAPGELDPRVQSAVSIPLISSMRPGGGSRAEPRLLGVAVLSSFSSPQAFVGPSLDSARALCSVISLAMGYQLLEVFQQKTLAGVMEQVCAALDARDPYTVGHSARAAALALLIGEKLNLPKEGLEELRLGMALHDIGNVAIPDVVLHKTGKLTEEEYRQVTTHTTVGYSICSPLMLSPTALMIIRSHHERLDGTGYPDGLKGDELPLPVRIAGVAIAFVAMKSPRPWRGPLTAEETLAELNRSAGRQFDPVVVQTLRSVLDEPRYFEIYPEDSTPGKVAA